MTNEDLNKYKEKLSNLTEIEQELRNQYLRRIAAGEQYGPMVGYPTIDMPNLASYPKDYKLVDNKRTITEALIENNKDNLDTIAIKYFFTNITYREFEEKINHIVKALSFYGIEKGSYVGVISAGIPEAMETIYALGYLGAVGIYAPPYLDKDNMVSDFSKNNTKMLMIMDLVYNHYKEELNYVIEKVGIEKVIIIPTLNSSVLGKHKKNPKLNDEKFEYFNDFIENGSNTILPPMVKHEPDMLAAVVYSSGTSGILKGVPLTHDSFNEIAESYRGNGFNFRKGQVIYQAIPIWSSTGLITVGTIPLYYGETIYQNPKFDSKTFCLSIGLYRITWAVGTTELFKGLRELRKKWYFNILVHLGILDYSKLDTVHIGGTFSSFKDRRALDKDLKSVGSPAESKSGYGNCENGSIVSAELNSEKYPKNSVGRPIPGAVVCAIDKEGNELPYGERGELVVKTKYGMKEYYNRPDLTEKVFYYEKGSGNKMMHTGDVGYVRSDGIVIYHGRMSDVSVVDGKEIYNFDIKHALIEDEDIFDVEAFVNPDGVFCANIIFENEKTIDFERKFREIQERLYSNFGDEAYVVKSFKVRNSFPMAASTKRDYIKLKEEKDGYVDVPFREEKRLTLK